MIMAMIRPETEMKNSGIEWIGNIPQNWDAVQIRRVLLKDKNGIKIGPFGSALTNKTTGNDEYYVYSQANLVSGDFSDTKNKVSQDVFNSLSNYEVVTGDVCLSMMGTIGKCRIIPHNIKKGIMDSHLIKIRLDNYNSRFFEYVYDKDNGGICFVQMQKEKKGSIMDGLNTSIVKGLYVTVPPLSEQQAIADYLDEICSKIDEIIAEAKVSIDEYKELRQGVIFEAVTKGLDKNVEMKDSGIEWIGEIPSSWHLTKVRRVIEQSKNGIKVGPFGSALTNKTSGEAPIYIYGQANLVANDFSFAKNRISEETYSTLSSYEVVPGDICLSMMGTIGKCHTVPENINKGIMDSHLIKIRLNDLMDNRYFEYVYDKDLSGICFIQMQYDKKGSIMDGLNTSIVKGLILPLPTKQEQQMIVDYLDKEVPKIDSLISEKESLINDLEAYKKSLIYEVVTGKRRVV